MKEQFVVGLRAAVPPHVGEQLGKAQLGSLCELAVDDELRLKMGHAARERVRERHSAAALAESLHRVYVEVAGEVDSVLYERARAIALGQVDPMPHYPLVLSDELSLAA